MSTYISYYASQDLPGGDAAPWSVYREEYEDIDDDAPIDGSEKWVSRHPTEAEAVAEMHRLYRLAHGETDGATDVARESEDA